MRHNVFVRLTMTVAGVLLLAVAAGAQTLVPAAQITALKREYPYVRFEQLMDISAPPPRHDLGSASKVVASADASRLIPVGARALHQQRVSIRGWVVPVVVDREGISEFILSSSIDSCHFGVIGGPTEWVYVTMARGRRIPNPGTSAVTIFGVLDVGADVRDGLVDSLYRMRGDRVAMQ